MGTGTKDFDIDTAGIIDDETFERMQELERTQGRRGRPTDTPQLPPSRWNPKNLEVIADGKVWVKCIVTLQPWANDVPMKLWEDHLVSVDAAILLDRRRHAVILQPPLEKKEK